MQTPYAKRDIARPIGFNYRKPTALVKARVGDAAVRASCEEIADSLRRDSHALDAALKHVEVMAMDCKQRDLLVRLSAAAKEMTHATAELLAEIL